MRATSLCGCAASGHPGGTRGVGVAILLRVLPSPNLMEWCELCLRVGTRGRRRGGVPIVEVALTGGDDLTAGCNGDGNPSPSELEAMQLPNLW